MALIILVVCVALLVALLYGSVIWGFVVTARDGDYDIALGFAMAFLILTAAVSLVATTL